MIILPHHERTFFKEGKSYCSFCKEEVSWCTCGEDCHQGFHMWAEDCSRCVYCLISRVEAIRTPAKARLEERTLTQ